MGILRNLIFKIKGQEYYNPQYMRSLDYRSDYISRHPGIKGLYMCSYCGKIIFRKHMQIDHIIPVNLARTHKLYRKMLGDKNVNDPSNLTCSCARCNQRKGSKGGIWVVTGKLGPIVQYLLWALYLTVLAGLVYALLTGATISSLF